MIIQHKTIVDTKKLDKQYMLEFFQGDTGRQILFDIRENGIPYDTTDCIIRYNFVTKDKTFFDELNSDLTLNVTSEMLANHGLAKVNLIIYKNGEAISTNYNIVKINKSYRIDKEVVASNEFAILTKSLSYVDACVSSVNELKTQVTNLGTATPQMAYESLEALKTDYPIGCDGVVLVKEDGYYYVYMYTTEWTKLCLYQSVIDGSIELEKINRAAMVLGTHYNVTISNSDNANKSVAFFYFDPLTYTNNDGIKNHSFSFSITPNYDIYKLVVGVTKSSNNENVEVQTLTGLKAGKTYDLSLDWSNKFTYKALYIKAENEDTTAGNNCTLDCVISDLRISGNKSNYIITSTTLNGTETSTGIVLLKINDNRIVTNEYLINEYKNNLDNVTDISCKIEKNDFVIENSEDTYETRMAINLINHAVIEATNVHYFDCVYTPTNNIDMLIVQVIRNGTYNDIVLTNLAGGESYRLTKIINSSYKADAFKLIARSSDTTATVSLDGTISDFSLMTNNVSSTIYNIATSVSSATVIKTSVNDNNLITKSYLDSRASQIETTQNEKIEGIEEEITYLDNKVAKAVYSANCLVKNEETIAISITSNSCYNPTVSFRFLDCIPTESTSYKIKFKYNLGANAYIRVFAIKIVDDEETFAVMGNGMDAVAGVEGSYEYSWTSANKVTGFTITAVGNADFIGEIYDIEFWCNGKRNVDVIRSTGEFIDNTVRNFTNLALLTSELNDGIANYLNGSEEVLHNLSDKNGVLYYNGESVNGKIALDGTEANRSVAVTVDDSIIGQQYLGGYIEIQPDSWDGTNVPATDDSTACWGFPFSLSRTEQKKIKNEMFNGINNIMYIRFPLGFAYRGYRNIDETTGLAKNIGERFKGQNKSLKEWFSNISVAGGGLAPEYWCPAPYWVTGKKYSAKNHIWAGGDYARTVYLAHIKETDSTQYNKQIDEFTNAIVDDLEYLHQNIAPVRMFGLQNEPTQIGDNIIYGTCYYEEQLYNDILEVLYPKIQASTILSEYEEETNEVKLLVASSNESYPFNGIAKTFIYNHPSWIWGYTHHMTTAISGESYSEGAEYYKSEDYQNRIAGKENVILNEFEYFRVGFSHDNFKCSNNMLRYINELVYGKAQIIHPVIHICKPIGQTSSDTNTEGYCLYASNLLGDYGKDVTASGNTYGLAKGTVVPNKMMYNAWKMVGENIPIGAYLIGDYSTTIERGGYAVLKANGKMYILIANTKENDMEITFNFSSEKEFEGKLYNMENVGTPLTKKKGTSIKFYIPKYSGQCWIETDYNIKTN